jgi:outer membrane lipoprotein-sorting protein
MFTYSHIVMTPGLPDSALKLDIPSGIKVTKLK